MPVQSADNAVAHQTASSETTQASSKPVRKTVPVAIKHETNHSSAGGPSTTLPKLGNAFDAAYIPGKASQFQDQAEFSIGPIKISGFRDGGCGVIPN